MIDVKNKKQEKRPVSRLDVVAVICAVLLSAACMARGVVYDVGVGFLLLLSIPLLFAASYSVRVTHAVLRAAGMVLLAGFTIILLLQQGLPASGPDADIWQQTKLLTGMDIAMPIVQDKAAWLQGIGRMLLLSIIFFIALAIGSSESSSRLFLQGLLVSGAACVALTFFMATANGVPTAAHYSYAHGFVNPNNAATYLGVMLLLALAQASRFFRRPHGLHRIFPDIIDRFNIASIIKGFFILFSLLLFLAGLFMTGSRGGIFLSLICSFLFCMMVVLKTNLKSRTRKWIIALTVMGLGIILIWSFINFGEIFMRKLERDGADHNTRLEIFSAVLPMISDHFWLGVGLGGFPGVFQQYRPENVSADGIIDKAHNTYLEFAAEMGMPALVMLIGIMLLVGYILYKGVQERRERYAMPVLGLSAWLLVGTHSLVDFPLQIPGIAALVVALLTICASQTDPRFSEPAESPSKAIIKRVRIRKRKRGDSKRG